MIRLSSRAYGIRMATVVPPGPLVDVIDAAASFTSNVADDDA